MKTTVVLLVLGLCLAACGEETSTVAGAFPVPSWAKVAPEQIAEAKKHGVPVAFENDLGMRFVLIPAGTFLMGSPEDEEARDDYRLEGDVERQHEVTISLPYYISIHEVTNEQFRGWRPTHSSGSHQEQSLDEARMPVVQVHHGDAVGFAAWMSGRDGERSYALPTEAQWEWACRANTTTSYHWGEAQDDFPKYANALDRTAKPLFPFLAAEFAGVESDGHAVSAPVGTYAPNAWGLYDMAGNVAEWCSDWFGAYPEEAVTNPKGPPSGKGGPGQSPWYVYRVIRGSSWHALAQYHRSARRASTDPKIGMVNLGFRLVSPLPEKAE